MPARAEKYPALDAAAIGGGGAANAATAIARLGGYARFTGHVGGDDIARMIREGLEGEGVDVSGLTVAPAGRSACSSVLIDARGERQIVNFRGEGLDLRPTPPRDRFDAVLVDTRRCEAALAHLAAARAAGRPGIVDGETPVDPRFLDLASHLAFSEQGLRDFTGQGDPVAGLASLDTPAWCAVTTGPGGVHWRCGSAAGHVPTFPIDPVDTLGAGDTWHGAFALRLAEGAGEGEAMRFANAAAALKCTRFGVRAAMPLRAEVEALLT